MLFHCVRLGNHASAVVYAFTKVSVVYSACVTSLILNIVGPMQFMVVHFGDWTFFIYFCKKNFVTMLFRHLMSNVKSGSCSKTSWEVLERCACSSSLMVAVLLCFNKVLFAISQYQAHQAWLAVAASLSNQDNISNWWIGSDIAMPWEFISL